jgi:hypothetical protein
VKSLVNAFAVTAVLVVPVLSFAQSNQPVTRAQVRAELVELNDAGYNPATANGFDYPANIRAAEAHIAARKVAEQPGIDGYGPLTTGLSESGQ